MKELHGLTGLRFLAAFFVFAFHMEIRTGLGPLPAPVGTVIRHGALGVNLFFVLSGFILTYAHLKDFPTASMPDWAYYKRFLYKRLARIYPAYFVGMLACLGVSIVLKEFPADFPLIAALDATMLESYVPKLSMPWYGCGAWSVSTEFFFYLLFPVLLPVLMRLRTKKHVVIMLAVTVLLGSLPGILHVLNHEQISFQLNYTFPLSRLPEFVSGILFALLVLRYDFRVPEWSALLLLLVTSLYLAKFGSRLPGFTIHNYIVIPTIIATISVLLRAEKTRFFSWVSSPLMQYGGKISFSFYIIQIPLMLMLDINIERGIIHRGDFGVLAIITVINFVSAVILYEFVEKKAHRYLIGQLADKRRVTA